ncbi:MAG: IclR family transcriptional regulator [Phyllobacterium sp.]
MTEDDESDRYRAPALDKGLDILELLAGIDGGVTQAEIAKRLGRGPNEFYRMLDRLVRRGYVTRIEGDRYALTLKLFGLAQLHAPVRRLAAYATPLMRELAVLSKQANHLCVFDRGAVVVVAQQEAPEYWGVSIRVGSHMSLFNTGSGHVLMAFRSQEERSLMIAEYERHADDNPEPGNYRDKLEEIRRRGFEIMPSAQTAGVFNISAPVLGPDGRAIAAVTCPYLQVLSLPDAPAIEDVCRMLVVAAHKLSQLSGADVRQAGPEKE